jgi:hypothetical protein
MAGRRLAAIVLACLAVAATATAEHYTHISGRVLDASDAGVPEAAISLVNEDTGFRRVTTSQADGTYSITSLQPGAYRIAVRKEGFRTVMRFGLRLESSQPARLNITLPVGSMQDSITVEGSAPLLDAEAATVATQVHRDEIARLPLNGRGVLSLLELAPGTVATPQPVASPVSSRPMASARIRTTSRWTASAGIRESAEAVCPHRPRGGPSPA